MKTFFLLIALCLHATAQLRIKDEGFGVSEKEIRPLLESVIEIFNHKDLPPMLVVRGHNGPIALFERSPRGEVVIQLDTHDRYWAQYVYQFAHELTHVAAKFKPWNHPNKWFEEALCEMASIYSLRVMSET